MKDREILPDVIHDISLNFDEKDYLMNGEVFGKGCQRFELNLYGGGAEVYVLNCDGSEERVKYRKSSGLPGIKRWEYAGIINSDHRHNSRESAV